MVCGGREKIEEDFQVKYLIQNGMSIKERSYVQRVLEGKGEGPLLTGEWPPQQHSRRWELCVQERKEKDGHTFRPI